MGHPAFVGEITKKVTASRDDNLEAGTFIRSMRTFIKESRKKRAGATKLHRKFGEARGRDAFTER
jgi:hypothetical protein